LLHICVFLKKYATFACMKKEFVKIITGISLVALLSVQGIWLTTTYSLLYKNLITQLEEGFVRSIEKEVYQRFDRTKIQQGTIIGGVRPDNDFYINVLAFHEFSLSHGFPLSFTTLDSIWSQRLQDEVGDVKYILMWTDAAGNIFQKITRGANEKSPNIFMIERPIRNDHSEYLRVIIVSPYKIVLHNMMFLLVISLIIAMILIYCLYVQIRIIIRQERIATIRQDFTQGMVHDMKMPVSSILMSAKYLINGKLDDINQRKEDYIRIILKEGNRLLAFTHKILTIAKMEGHKVDLSKRDIDLKELCNKLMEEYLLIPAKEIHFTTDIEDGVVIHADPEYMDDVFRNLIDNAIKYSKKSVTIEITGKSNPNQTIVTIRDNGIGIAPKDQKRIFKKYERIHSGKEEDGGFGLGLYYVYQVVSAHDGSVGVESVPDVYSEFTVRIPNKKV